jgi:chemotaxis protein histidine kinase CheA
MVVLSIGKLKLFLARYEVRSLELAEDMQLASSEDHEIGWHRVQGEQIPIYGLGEDLALLRQRPETSRIVVVLAAGETSIAILCDEVTFLESAELSFQDIPDCMTGCRSLLSGLAIYGDIVGCVTTSERLAAYLLESTDKSRTSLQS